MSGINIAGEKGYKNKSGYGLDEPVLDTSPPDPIVCKQFGCKKHLSSFESLRSDYCYEHQNNKPKEHSLLLFDKYKDTYFDTIKLKK